MEQTIEEIINRTFNILDEELSTYVVMNKYDEIPYSLPSDIDINVTQKDFERLDLVIRNLAHKTNLLITQKIWHNYRKCAYILTPLHITKPFRLQLDFFSDFSVTSTPLLIPCHEMQNKTRKYGRFTVPDFKMEFIFLLMRRIYKGDFDDEHCEILKRILIKDEKNIIEYASQYMPGNSIKKIAFLLMEGDLKQIMEFRPQLWKELKQLSNKQSKGLYFFKYWLNQIQRTIYRVHYPVGMSIAFLSPDGGGKSTIINSLKTTCWGSFHGIEVKYFRPRLFANLGHYNVVNPSEEAISNIDPHGKKLDNPMKSFIRFMFYNLDFILGTVEINKMKIQKKLIVFDRYYFDYFVDMERYKYNLPKFIPHIFSLIIPKPNIIFILNGDAETLYKRKQELPLDELKRQTSAYLEVAQKVKNAEIIDVNTSIENVVDAVTAKVLLYKAKKTAKAMNMSVDNLGILEIPL